MDGVKLPVELERLIEGFRKWDSRKRHADEVASVVRVPLHHYSDMASLVGVVQHSELWLTSIFHLNDPSELRHGLNIAIDRLNWHLSRNVSENALAIAPLIVDSFCQHMQDALENNIGKQFGFFVGSFSRTRDDLAQWRAYADDGRGAAMEIGRAWFKPSNRTNTAVQDKYFVSDVVYDVNEARKRQHAAIDRAVAIMKKAAATPQLRSRPVRALFQRDLSVALSVPLLWNSVTTKHHAYAHEAETRLILINNFDALKDVIRTRTRGSQIVSYVPIKFPVTKPGMLRHVMIGPAAGGSPASGVENLLRAKGIDPKARVSQSQIPYRPR